MAWCAVSYFPAFIDKTINIMKFTEHTKPWSIFSYFKLDFFPTILLKYYFPVFVLNGSQKTFGMIYFPQTSTWSLEGSPTSAVHPVHDACNEKNFFTSCWIATLSICRILDWKCNCILNEPFWGNILCRLRSFKSTFVNQVFPDSRIIMIPKESIYGCLVSCWGTMAVL